LLKGKGYPTLVEQVTDPSVVFVTIEEGRETTKLVTALKTWKEARRKEAKYDMAAGHLLLQLF